MYVAVWGEFGIASSPSRALKPYTGQKFNQASLAYAMLSPIRWRLPYRWMSFGPETLPK
jgi:hypothetical protein